MVGHQTGTDSWQHLEELLERYGNRSPRQAGLDDGGSSQAGSTGDVFAVGAGAAGRPGPVDIFAEEFEAEACEADEPDNWCIHEAWHDGPALPSGPKRYDNDDDDVDDADAHRALPEARVRDLLAELRDDYSDFPLASTRSAGVLPSLVGNHQGSFIKASAFTGAIPGFVFTFTTRIWGTGYFGDGLGRAETPSSSAGGLSGTVLEYIVTDMGSVAKSSGGRIVISLDSLLVNDMPTGIAARRAPGASSD